MYKDKIHTLAVESGFETSFYLNKLTSKTSFCDGEIRKYTELLIEDVFNTIRQVSQESGVLDNESLKQKVLSFYNTKE